MAENKEINEQEEEFTHHPIFGLWVEEDDSDKQAFVIKCECGQTKYNVDKEMFAEPQSRIFPGMTIDEFQKMQKNYQKFKGMKKQIQRVALAQHAESHPHCPAIEKMKKDAGVSNVRELPSPFRDAR